MKFVKRISYFFVIPVVFLILGIFLGVWGIHFFYPGQWQDLNENRLAAHGRGDCGRHRSL